jgi:predicted nucleic acid-binding protein
MGEALCLIDSNVLIRWVQPNDADAFAAGEAIAVLASRQVTLCYTSQNFGEFWNACTRPVNRNGYGLLPEEAERRARHFEQRLRLLPDSVSVHNEWRRLLILHGVSGVEVHDTRLVAAMHVHRVQQILTFNAKDFVRFREIEAVRPGDLLGMT